MPEERKAVKDARNLFPKKTVDRSQYNPVKMVNEIFSDEDKKVKELIETFYEKEASNKNLSSQERAALISKLEEGQDYFGWIIGDILLQEREKIYIEVENFKSGKTDIPPTFYSLNDFYNQYSDHFSFTLQTMYNYIKTREVLDPDTLKKIGMRKALLIIRIPEIKKRNIIIEKIIEKNLTIAEVKKEIDNIFNKDVIKSDQKEIDLEKYKKLNKSHPINITQNNIGNDLDAVDTAVVINETKNILSDKKIDHADKIKFLTEIIPRDIKENERLITFKNKSEADKFDIAFSKYELKIKEEMEKINLEG